MSRIFRPETCQRSVLYPSHCAFKPKPRSRHCRQNEKAGVPAYLSPIQAKSGKIYRVQAGPFKSAKEAEAANAKLGFAGLNTGKVQSVR
ncbi:MAG: SPOR domain-containing protein [Parasutterella sp.]